MARIGRGFPVKWRFLRSLLVNANIASADATTTITETVTINVTGTDVGTGAETAIASVTSADATTAITETATISITVTDGNGWRDDFNRDDSSDASSSGAFPWFVWHPSGTARINSRSLEFSLNLDFTGDNDIFVWPCTGSSVSNIGTHSGFLEGLTWFDTSTVTNDPAIRTSLAYTETLNPISFGALPVELRADASGNVAFYHSGTLGNTTTVTAPISRATAVRLKILITSGIAYAYVNGVLLDSAAVTQSSSRDIGFHVFGNYAGNLHVRVDDAIALRDPDSSFALTPSVVPSQSDSGSGAESSPSIALSLTDSGTGTDTATTGTAFTATDTGSGAQTDPNVAQSQSDTGSGAESASVIITVTALESGVGTETAPNVAQQATADLGFGQVMLYRGDANGFEGGVGGWTDPINPLTGITSTTADFYEGTHSLLLTRSGDGAPQGSTVPCNPGDDVQLSCYVKTFATINRQFRLRIHTSDGTDFFFAGGSPIVSHTTWTPITINGTVPATASSMYAWVELDVAVNDGEGFYIDAVVLTTNAVNIAQTQPDASTGSETTSTTATLSSSDSGTESESASVTNDDIAVSGTDTATGTEASPNIAQAFTDTGSGADTASIDATVSSADVGTCVETDPNIAQSESEVSAGAETGTIAASISASDATTGAEQAPDIAQSVSDVGTGAEEAHTSVAVTVLEAGTGNDGGPPSLAQISVDGGGSQETSSTDVSSATSDDGTDVEDAPNIAFTASEELASGSDEVQVSAEISSDDAGSLVSDEATTSSVRTELVVATGTEVSVDLAFLTFEVGSGTEGAEGASVSAVLTDFEYGAEIEGDPDIAFSTLETAVGADSAEQSQTVLSSDAGFVAEQTPNIAFSAIDSGASNESAEVIASALITSSDDGTGVEGDPDINFVCVDQAFSSSDESLTAVITVSDAGTGTDGTGPTAPLGLDTGTSSESSQLQVLNASQDSGEFAESTPNIRQTQVDAATTTQATATAAELTGVDEGTGDDFDVHLVDATDSGTGTETEVLSIVRSASDASGPISELVSRSLTVQDVAHGAQTAVVSVQVSVTDNGTTSDVAQAAISRTTADFAVGSDTASLLVSITASDSGSSTESAIFVLSTDDSSGSVIEYALALFSGATDHGTSDESAVITAEITGVDSLGQITETWSLALLVSDVGSVVDSAVNYLVVLREVTVTITVSTMAQSITALDRNINVTAGSFNLSIEAEDETVTAESLDETLDIGSHEVIDTRVGV